jgi:hypothetical protein
MIEVGSFSKVLACGCVIHAEVPLHVPGNVSIEWCRLHQGAGALRNALRWIHRNESFWVPLPEAEERILYALEAVGDT